MDLMADEAWISSPASQSAYTSTQLCYRLVGTRGRFGQYSETVGPFKYLDNAGLLEISDQSLREIYHRAQMAQRIQQEDE